MTESKSLSSPASIYPTIIVQLFCCNCHVISKSLHLPNILGYGLVGLLVGGEGYPCVDHMCLGLRQRHGEEILPHLLWGCVGRNILKHLPKER
jgi:hypothetical protein